MNFGDGCEDLDWGSRGVLVIEEVGGSDLPGAGGGKVVSFGDCEVSIKTLLVEVRDRQGTVAYRYG